MPGSRKLQGNGGVADSSDSTTDEVIEAIGRLKMENNYDNGAMGNELDCMYYLRTGTCGYGSNCRFNHPSNGNAAYGVINASELPERAGQPDCVYYLKTGTCKYGSTCKYHHPKDRQIDSLVYPNILGLPMRQDAKPCQYYMQTGLCKYGYSCKFHHPQPMPTASVFPSAGLVHGSSRAAVVPSSAAPSVDELPKQPLQKETYFSSSILQHPQSYMPLVLPPSLGWNTYVGSFSPFSMTSVTNGQISASYLPERPDQPKCRYFMNHGSCKYGTDCRYNHPRENISELTSGSLGPLGLPLRPGQPACLHYTMYGLCKYGPICKFDHPLDGYSYAYTYSAPPLATPYNSHSSVYQRM